MAFTRPTLTDLVARDETDLKGRLAGGDALLRRSIERALARSHAGSVHGLYGRLDSLAMDLMPDSASGPQLARWAGVWGLEKKPATAATGPAQLTGVNGSIVEAETRLQRSDGVEYRVTADVTIVGGVATAALEASLPGVAGLAEEGTALTFVSPVAGVASAAVVGDGGLTGGAEEESDPQLLDRLLARIRQQPQGGAGPDYVRWAREIAGVTRAWVFPERSGLGTVGVAFVMDGREDIIPLGGDLTTVANHIADLRPVTAQVTVFALAPVELDLTIELSPDDADTRAAVEAELRDLLAREAEPGGTILLSHIREAISIAAGETDHVLTVPSANVTADDEEIIVLGDITWS
ncbi:MAG: baseplate J protein [Caulobacter sp.]|nr:baseplate J protein [Caulobacter sp.]